MELLDENRFRIYEKDGKIFVYDTYTNEEKEL